MPSCENISYMLLNLVGEVGELASKIAKNIRKENIYIGGQKDLKGLSKLCIYPHFIDDMEDWDEELKKELGDILWQTAGVASVMGWTLEEVGAGNLEKLAKRKAAGTIVGNGDGIIREK